MQAALGHALGIPACVLLFLVEGVQDAAAEGLGGIRELEQGQSHQFDGQQFVVGKEMEQHGAAAFVDEGGVAGEAGAGVGVVVCAGDEVGRASGQRRSVHEGRPRVGVLQSDVARRAGQLFLQSGGEKHAFGKFADRGHNVEWWMCCECASPVPDHQRWKLAVVMAASSAAASPRAVAKAVAQAARLAGWLGGVSGSAESFGNGWR